MKIAIVAYQWYWRLEQKKYCMYKRIPKWVGDSLHNSSKVNQFKFDMQFTSCSMNRFSIHNSCVWNKELYMYVRSWICKLNQFASESHSLLIHIAHCLKWTWKWSVPYYQSIFLQRTILLYVDTFRIVHPSD